MRLFRCQHCDQLLYFENRWCESCKHRLGYLPSMNALSAVEPDGDDWCALAARNWTYRFCDNAAFDACNWLIPTESDERYCAACRHNRTIPDLQIDENLARWRKLELAKHRLFYSLLRLRLPLANRTDDPQHGLAFDFLRDAPQTGAVLTGHDQGVITIALKEADDVEREAMRQRMGETYRTLLGHFRHEVGHHFWDVLVQYGGRLDDFRRRFGDESRDYGQALQAHYNDGPPPNWQESHITAYACSHPWEDFAETWAHYLHIVDTLEMAAAFGLRVHPKIDRGAELSAKIDFDPYHAPRIEDIVNAWLPLTFAVNSLNRSMGQPDLYPFILSMPVIDKLAFIHDLIRERAARRVANSARR